MWPRIRRGSWSTSRRVMSWTAPMTACSRASIVPSPQPTIPASVSMRTKTQLRQLPSTAKALMTVIFIAPAFGIASGLRSGRGQDLGSGLRAGFGELLRHGLSEEEHIAGQYDLVEALVE